MKIKHITFRFAIALITFIIGVSAAAVWFLRRQPPKILENPPCRSCAQIYSSASSALETVSFADLAANSERFRGRIVRVQANLHNDAGYKSLYAPASKNEGARLSAEFNDLSSYGACDGVKKALHDIAGIDNWFDGSAGVVVVGRLGQLNHFRRGEFGFEIMCVERAYPSDVNVP